jgi:hypothetical protein
MQNAKANTTAILLKYNLIDPEFLTGCSTHSLSQKHRRHTSIISAKEKSAAAFAVEMLTVSARKKLSMWSSCLWVSTSDMWQ